MLKKILLSLILVASVVPCQAGLFTKKPKPNIANITKSKNSLCAAMTSAKDTTTSTSGEIQSAYTQIKIYLSNNNVSYSEISTLEKEFEVIKAKADSLNESFVQCKSKANDLFKLLERRAKENRTKTLRKKLLTDISEKEAEFDLIVKRMNQIGYQIRISINNYDDIVGYFQVSEGLDGIDGIISDINVLIASSIDLNSELNKKFNEGISIIN